MEVIGLAFATISVVESLLQAYSSIAVFVRSVNKFEEDKARLLAKLAAEKAITRNLRDLLFDGLGPNPGDGGTCIFASLDLPTQHSVNLIFEEFAKTIQEYLVLDDRYKLSKQNGNPIQTLPQPVSLALIESAAASTANVKEVSLPIQSKEPDLAEPSQSKAKAFRWAFRDKRRLTELLGDFEAWNLKVTQLLQLCLLRRQFFMAQLRQPLDIKLPAQAQDLGIVDVLAAQAIAVPDVGLASELSNSAQKDFMKPWTVLRNTRRPSASSSFEIGRVDSAVVLVDSKHYQGSENESQRKCSIERLNQLASILNHLHRVDGVIPDCLCWIERVDKGAFSLLLPIPAHLEPRPMSLFDVLPPSSVSSGPSLEARYRIAFRLASAVDRLHSVSWVHKNLRSESIIFYHPKEAVQGSESTGSDPEIPSDWFIYGFEFARPMDSSTSLKSDANFERNVYRHPQRWGVPTEAFSAIHDVYGLGVILLELGTWRKATSIIKSNAMRPADPVQIKNALVERAKSHLRFSAGERYRDVVLRCLQSDFDLHETDHGSGSVSHSQLGTQFREFVVDELRLLAYPSRESSQRIAHIGWGLQPDKPDSATEEEVPRTDKTSHQSLDKQ